MNDNVKHIADLSPKKRELLLRQLSKKRNDISLKRVSPQKRTSNAFPLSFAQQRLWFLHQLEPNSPFYNITIAVRLRGQLHVGALEQSLGVLLQRHESLRTTFATQEGRPVQVIASPQSLHWRLPVVDLAALPEPEREAEMLRLVSQEAWQPFDLAHGPLIRITLLRLSETEQALLLVLHHIIADEWSMEVLFRELAVLYEASISGKPVQLPALPIQYADFAVWQRQWLQGPVLEEQLSYWRQQLADLPDMLQLPTDYPRPAVQTFRGATQTFELPRSLSQTLKGLSRQQGVTLFMMLLAAFQTLLHRYTGQDDLAVGSPIANRNQGEIEGLIGFFVNTQVLRADLSGDPTFQELLRRVREVALEAYAHQDLPFEMLVEALQPERDLSHNPLFQVMFVLQDDPTQSLKLTGLKLSPLEVASGTAQFDLALSMTDTEQGLVGKLEYSTDLFNATTIDRMIGHFQTLLEGIVTHPEQRLSQLPLLTAAERLQLLVEWNATQADYPQERCIHALFEAQVKQRPQAVAVVCGEKQLTYRELNERANQLAHYLQKLGVRPERPVGICMERSVEMVVGLLAILKAGGAYIPLDPAYPKERLAFMLEDAQVPLLLTQAQLLIELPVCQARKVCLDADWEIIAQEDTRNLPSEVMIDNLAYIIYTSGSTGRPKGVLIPHRALVNHCTAFMKHYDFQSSDRVLQFASISFDVAAEELFPTWASGATIVVWADQPSASLAALQQFMEKERLTVLNLPVSYWHEWASELSRSGTPLPATLRLVIVGSEKALVERLATWQKHVKDSIRWSNAYGLTEATITSTIYEPAIHRESREVRSVPIGRPIANTQIFVLDPHMQPVPVGVPGELHVGGIGLARGYLNRAELTAEKFIPHPFSDEPGARLYKTGDLARYLPDGNIESLGRFDSQVKVRGYRIELGEIEAVLGQHPALQETVVMAREDIPGDKRLIAYIVPKQKQSIGSSELRAYLKARLPEYMVPSAFVVLNSLPLRPNGKVDRNALPTPGIAKQESEGSSAYPRTSVEEVLTKVWAEVLGLEQVGMYDNFFELGGHSLLATQVVSRICDSLQVELPLRCFFERPNIAGLAEHIEMVRRAEQSQRVPPILPVAQDGDLPLSFAQKRLWFLNQLEPDSVAYNMPIATRLRGQLHVGALEQSLGVLLQRHESLRTTFATQEGRPVQVIASPQSLHWRLPVVDLAALPEPEREAEMLRLVSQEAWQPFDLAHGPLIRITLLRLSETEHVLLLVLHHIISDGWSMGIFFRELAVLYEASISGKPVQLPALPIQYADFAVWQRQWLQGPVLEEQLSYWRQQLASAPKLLKLPTDRPRSSVQTSQGGIHSFVLSNTLAEALRALSRREGVTLFMTLLAVFKTLLHCYTGCDDIVVGTDVAGRSRIETEGLIGFFVNQLVLRTNMSGDPSFLELLRRVREVTLGAYAHQDLPFEKLVEALKPERSLQYAPLFQVKIILQNTATSSLRLPGLILSPLEFGIRTAQLDLILNLSETPEGLVGSFEYNADLFEADTIDQMACHLEALLHHVVTHPDARLSTLEEVLAEARRQQHSIRQSEYREIARQRLNKAKRKAVSMSLLKGKD